MSDLWLVLLLIGWYCGMWLMGRRYQLLKGFGKDSRIHFAPRWLVFLCGIPDKSEDPHLPYAMGQLAAIFALITSIALVIMLPGNSLREHLLFNVATVPFLFYALGYAVIGVKRVLQRLQR